MTAYDRMKELVDKLNRYAALYYEEDAPVVSDAEYDALYFSVPPEDMGLDAPYGTVNYPLEFNLLRSDGGGLVSLRPAPEMTVS